ncbi:hypothetical protein PITC_046270 [Penicillium italicum]|uniref:Uncharacterized protein n=1 Tax=Penicillium italicum TaxID=40296 RepID=A0A0A2KH26_PENIT|nr:hypothetical protein PITC_046270 [Penicillium italicum]
MALQPREGPSTAFLWPPFPRLGHVVTIYCIPILVLFSDSSSFRWGC